MQVRERFAHEGRSWLKQMRRLLEPPAMQRGVSGGHGLNCRGPAATVCAGVRKVNQQKTSITSLCAHSAPPKLPALKSLLFMSRFGFPHTCPSFTPPAIDERVKLSPK